MILIKREIEVKKVLDGLNVQAKGEHPEERKAADKTYYVYKAQAFNRPRGLAVALADSRLVIFGDPEDVKKVARAQSDQGGGDAGQCRGQSLQEFSGHLLCPHKNDARHNSRGSPSRVSTDPRGGDCDPGHQPG